MYKHCMHACQINYNLLSNINGADIDECAEQTDLCEYHETCVNTAGSYNCDCPDKADKLALDGHRCISKALISIKHC